MPARIRLPFPRISKYDPVKGDGSSALVQPPILNHRRQSLLTKHHKTTSLRALNSIHQSTNTSKPSVHYSDVQHCFAKVFFGTGRHFYLLQVPTVLLSHLLVPIRAPNRNRGAPIKSPPIPTVVSSLTPIPHRELHHFLNSPHFDSFPSFSSSRLTMNDFTTIKTFQDFSAAMDEHA